MGMLIFRTFFCLFVSSAPVYPDFDFLEFMHGLEVQVSFWIRPKVQTRAISSRCATRFELTGALQLVVPFMVAIMTANWVGSLRLGTGDFSSIFHWLEMCLLRSLVGLKEKPSLPEIWLLLFFFPGGLS